MAKVIRNLWKNATIATPDLHPCSHLFELTLFSVAFYSPNTCFQISSVSVETKMPLTEQKNKNCDAANNMLRHPANNLSRDPSPDFQMILALLQFQIAAVIAAEVKESLASFSGN